MSVKYEHPIPEWQYNRLIIPLPSYIQQGKTKENKQITHTNNTRGRVP